MLKGGNFIIHEGIHFSTRELAVPNTHITIGSSLHKTHRRCTEQHAEVQCHTMVNLMRTHLVCTCTQYIAEDLSNK